MSNVGRAYDWYGGWVDRGQRIAAARYAPALAAAVFGLAGVIESFVRYAGGSGGAQSALPLCLLALSTTLPLALPRPTLVGLAATVASALSLAAFHTLTGAGVAVQLIAGYRLGRDGSPVVATLAGAPFLVLALTGTGGSGIRTVTIALAALVPAAALAGIARRAGSEARERGAAHQMIADRLVEHTARGERARIARELHDVVAHHISMISVQAETARLTTPGMPPAGALRLSAIGDTAREALTEMRRLLGVLREDAHADRGQRRPQPGLAQLNDLLDESRDASGAGTRLILRGSPAALDPGVELAAYRIVQESLTNARRHAPGAAVDVELHYIGDGLRLFVRDNGPGPPEGAPVGGHGLLGMRERAAAVGGDLWTGPAKNGGFLVEALLPAKAEEAG